MLCYDLFLMNVYKAKKSELSFAISYDSAGITKFKSKFHSTLQQQGRVKTFFR